MLLKNSRNLKQVILGKNIVSIGKNAFAGCRNLKTVRIKSSNLKIVRKNAFEGINKKAVFHMPKKQRAGYQKILKL